MQAIYKPRKRVPSQRGNATAVILLLVLIAAFGLAAMGADVAHLVSVKAQLQNASDAGALAGAQNLLKINPTSQDQTNANNDAVATTASNVADATSVSNQTANTNVSVAVNAAAQPYTVTVQATRQAPSLFAGIFGASSEPVYTKSVAEASLGLKSLGPNQAINVAVSLNWAPPKGIQAGKALDSYAGLPLGQPFTLILNPQGETNAAWIKDWGGFFNPQIDFGTTQVNLDNGVKGSLVSPISVGDIIAVPIIFGGPPFNYQTTVWGIIGLKVTDVQWPQQVSGTLVTPILRGIPGQPVGLPDPQGQQFLTQYSPQVLQLIQ